MTSHLTVSPQGLISLTTRGQTETHTFTRVTFTAKRSLKCPACGKRFTRQRTFEGTINPFNKRPDGIQKNYSEVYADLKAKADAWEPELDHCDSSEVDA